MRWKFGALLAIALSCGGWIRGYPVPTFIGNPNATVTAITAATITASRTSGELPAFVQVSASAVTATGTMANGTTLNPYEDLDYFWDCGDSAGADTFTNYAVVPSATVSANYQRGPEAACLYRTAGTYTIRLMIRGCATPPTTAGTRCSSFRTATSTLAFTASTFDKSGGEFWFDQVGGNDANPGTLAQPKQSISALNALMTAGHMQFWLKRGSNWVGTTGIAFTRSDFRVGAYGSGANPIINMQNAADCAGDVGPTCNAISWDNTSRAVSNTVISGIDVWRSGTTPNTAIKGLFGATFTVVDNYLDNVNIVSDNPTANNGRWITYQFPQTGDPTNVNRFGVWGGSLTKTASDDTRDIGIYGGARAWNFFVGITPFSGNGDPAQSNLVHHIYANFLDHGLFRWINFGTSIDRNMCIKVAVNTLSGSYQTGSYWLISENNMTNTKHAFSGGNSQGVDAGLSDVQHYVVQLNSHHALSVAVADTQNILGLTWRYNNVWDVNTGNNLVKINSLGVLSAAELAVNFKSYGNNIYRSNPAAQTSGNSPLNQKIQVATGNATWDNGAGSSGTVLTVTSFSAGLGANVINGQMPLYANASAPGNAIISGASGSTTTGTYTLSQSFLITPTTGMQLVWGWTTPWTFTDNVIWDTSATATLMDLQFTNQAAATIDRNQWYAPNAGLATSAGTGTPFFNNRFAQTFAQLKAAGSPILFSIHDIVAQPSWPDPANGRFN